jgi:ABC-type branched-subunit amino acid transport system permease subunit
MTLIVIAGGTGFLVGAAVGALVSWLLHRRLASVVPLDYSAIDPAVDPSIRLAARQWADAYGQPASAPLIVNKLRLVHNLNRRRHGWRG